MKVVDVDAVEARLTEALVAKRTWNLRIVVHQSQITDEIMEAIHQNNIVGVYTPVRVTDIGGGYKAVSVSFAATTEEAGTVHIMDVITSLKCYDAIKPMLADYVAATITLSGNATKTLTGEFPTQAPLASAGWEPAQEVHRGTRAAKR